MKLCLYSTKHLLAVLAASDPAFSADNGEAKHHRFKRRRFRSFNAPAHRLAFVIHFQVSGNPHRVCARTWRCSPLRTPIQLALGLIPLGREAENRTLRRARRLLRGAMERLHVFYSSK
uniref:Putative secreted protein n=1 Tax=Ixodes ricinus TaxID=34613 RepID=A0A6B0UMV7_IXORI